MVRQAAGKTSCICYDVDDAVYMPPNMLPAAMREIDVRRALYKSEIRRIVESDPSSLVVDELGVMEGKYRIDVAVINGRLHGYEIKSAADNLDRLAAQQASYSQIFDRMTLVADERHVEEALKIIPSWWGLIAVSVKDGTPFLNEIWPSRQNCSMDPAALCQLLWRQEALEILSALGLAAGVRNGSRKLMWKLLAAVLSLDELRVAVSNKLKTRTEWRVGSLSLTRSHDGVDVKPVAVRPPKRKPTKTGRKRIKGQTTATTTRRRRSGSSSRRRLRNNPLPNKSARTTW